MKKDTENIEEIIEDFQDIKSEKDKKREKDEQNQSVDEVVFEDLNEDGEEMTERQKNKNTKEKLEEKYKEKIERLEKERDEYLNLWQRVQADYKNREKEIDEYKKTFTSFANSRLIRDLLPVLDGYDMAKVNKEMWESVDSNWRTGIEYLFSQMLSILSQNGLVTFGEIGEVYNPSLHEAVETIGVGEEDKNNKIIIVMQKGYKLGETILRPARVKVGEFKAKNKF